MDKTIVANNFTVFVTVLLPDYATVIVNGMLKKGYLVGSALEEAAFYFGKDEGQSFLVTFYCYKPNNALTVKIVNDDLMDIINTEKMSIYSAIVSERADASITCGNFSSPVDKQAVQQDKQHRILTEEEMKKLN